MAETFFKKPDSADLGEGVPMWGSDPPEDPHALAKAREAMRPSDEKVDKALAAFEETAPEEFWGDDEETEEPQTTAPEEAEKPSSPSELSALQEKIEGLEKRLRDTQSWGNQNNMQAINQRQLAETLLQMEQVRNQLAASQKAQEPPKVDEVLGMDMDDFLSDPAKARAGLERVGKAFAEWSHKQTISEVSPYLARLQSLDGYVQRTTGLQERSAYMLAREQAARANVATPEQFDALAERAYRAINERMQPADAWNARFEPDTIVAAIQYIANQDGLPVKEPSKVAPTAGAGSPGAKAKVATGSGKRNSMKRVERMLGITFGKEDVAPFNERWAS